MDADDLLLLFGCLFLAAMLGRILSTYRRTGRFPIIWHEKDTASNFIVRLIVAIVAMEALSIILYAIYDSYYPYLVPITYLEKSTIQSAGILLAYLSLGWSAIAQAQMGASWRVGIDTQQETALVAKGLYSFSRHPIYLGFISVTVGLFLAMPNAMSLVACVLAIVVLSIEARLEEEFLVSRYGDAYEAYLKQTRRWL